MNVKKVLSFNEEELQIIKDFYEKVLDPICKELGKDKCKQCPLNGHCIEIVNFIETVIENEHWTTKEEN